jgi:hypothetical protein
MRNERIAFALGAFEFAAKARAGGFETGEKFRKPAQIHAACSDEHNDGGKQAIGCQRERVAGNLAQWRHAGC